MEDTVLLVNPLSNSVNIQLDELSHKNIFTTVFNHIKQLILINPLDLSDTRVTLMHYIFLAIIYSLFCYSWFLFKLLVQFKAGSFIANLVFPTFPIIGCVTIIILSFLGGRIYGEFLNLHEFKNYYIVLLSGGYLPIIIVLSNIFPNLKIILYLCGAVISDYFIRESFLLNREFEDSNDKYFFMTLSMILNFGLYAGVFPEFFSNI